jgi:hypothetical protein
MPLHFAGSSPCAVVDQCGGVQRDPGDDAPIARAVAGSESPRRLFCRRETAPPSAFSARLPIGNQLKEETPSGGMTHEVVTAPRNRVKSKRPTRQRKSMGVKSRRHDNPSGSWR